MSCRGNGYKLERDAEKIVGRLLAGEAMSKIIAEYHVAWATWDKFHKAKLTRKQRGDLKKRRIERSVERLGPYRFEAGHEPANKGKKGWCPEGCKATWFKKGEMHGAAQHNYREIGSIVVRRDHGNGKGRRKKKGKRRRWIKVKDGGRPQDRHIHYARYVWEQEHGPIPPGASIVHRDGDSMNDDPGNLMLIADCAARLKWQKETIPAMTENLRESCAKAVRARWKRYRAEKAKLARAAAKLERQAKRKAINASRHKQAHAEAIQEDRNRDLVTQFRALASGDAEAWDCPACGNTVAGSDEPERCLKCGSFAFEPRPAELATA